MSSAQQLSFTPHYQITTVVGNGESNFAGDGSSSLLASLNTPRDLFLQETAPNTHMLYIADTNNYVIRTAIVNSTIETIAGIGRSDGFSGDGSLATNAKLKSPTSVTVFKGDVYICDSLNNRIRKVSSSTGFISTIAGNGVKASTGDGLQARLASLSLPKYIFFNAAGDLFISEYESDNIRKVHGTTGVISTINKDTFDKPQGMYITSNNDIYVADSGNHRIRKILPNGNVVNIAGNSKSGYSGDGLVATSSSLNTPRGVFVSSLGEVFIADTANNRIRKVTNNGFLVNIVGNGNQGKSMDGPVTSNFMIAQPEAVIVASNGDVYFTDTNNHLVRRISCQDGYVGSQCEIPICFNVLGNDTMNVCNGQGLCNSPDQCECNGNYTGRTCNISVCYGIASNVDSVCNGHGLCVAPNQCRCNENYIGPNCSTPICFGKSILGSSLPCSGHGACNFPNECTCSSNFVGRECEYPICYGFPSNDTVKSCSGNGVCVDFNNCSCLEQKYSGPSCEIPICFGQMKENACSRHGTCIKPNVCECENSYTGLSCEIPICFGLPQNHSQACGGNGFCSKKDTCSCHEGYKGEQCKTAICNGYGADDTKRVCNGLGVCIAPNLCQCTTGFAGNNCETSIQLVIILAAVLGPILLVIVCALIVVLFISATMARRLLNKRRAEREYAKKLLEGEIALTDSLIDFENYRPSESYIIPIEDVKLIAQLGEGSYAKVFRGIWNKTPVAVKVITLDILETDEEDFKKEVRVMNSLSHPNIVAFYGLSMCERERRLIVELVDGGNLQNFIYNLKIGNMKANFGRKIKILLDVANGLTYLHQRNPAVVHRDLKPANILMMTSSSGCCKICDFGLSKFGQLSLGTVRIGTFFYMAEIIAPKSNAINMKIPTVSRHSSPTTESVFTENEGFQLDQVIDEAALFEDEAIYGPPVDIYSLGIIFWELFFEESPYEFKNKDKLCLYRNPEFNKLHACPTHKIINMISCGLRPLIPFKSERECCEWLQLYYGADLNFKDLFPFVIRYLQLMKMCWKQNPDERPSASQVAKTLNQILEDYENCVNMR